MNEKIFPVTERPDYEGWVDIVRSLACFAVVLLHTCATPAKLFSLPVPNSWWIYNILISLSRFCIPVFYMLSGYLLLKREEETLPFLKYRLSKFLVPLLFWSFIYCLQSCREQHLPVTPVNVFRMILAGPAYYHLWFLYTLAALYCLIPVFRIFIRHAKPEMIWYALALWFLMASLLPFCLRIFYKFTGEHINWQPLVVLRGPAGYLIGGYILGRLKPSKRTALFCFGIYLLTAGLVAFGTMRLSLLQENYDGFLNDPVSSGMVVLSFSFFISAKYWGDSLTKKSLWLKIAQRVSPLTLGVFLIHPLLISYLFKKNAVTSFNFIYDPVFRITLKVVLVFTLSALCVWLISKVPVLKKTVSPAQR